MAMAAGLLHALRVQAHLVDLAVQLTGLLLLVRLVIYLLRVSLGTRARVKGWGTPVSIIVWVFLSLHVMGWGQDVIAVLDSIGINTGKTRISVWSIATLIVTIGLFVLAAVWISRWIEKRSGACRASRRTCASVSPSSRRRSWSGSACSSDSTRPGST